MPDPTQMAGVLLSISPKDSHHALQRRWAIGDHDRMDLPCCLRIELCNLCNLVWGRNRACCLASSNMCSLGRGNIQSFHEHLEAFAACACTARRHEYYALMAVSAALASGSRRGSSCLFTFGLSTILQPVAELSLFDRRSVHIDACCFIHAHCHGPGKQ